MTVCVDGICLQPCELVQAGGGWSPVGQARGSAGHGGASRKELMLSTTRSGQQGR